MRRRVFTVVLLVSMGGADARSSASVVAAVRGQTADPDELVKRGRTLMTLGKHDEAERLYRQALSVSPRSFEASRALGILLNLKGQYQEAQTHLQRAISVAPPATVRHQAMTALALSYAFEGKLADVERQYEAVRRQQQLGGDAAGAAASARSIGRILLEAGDVATGRKWYELTQGNVTDPFILNLIGMAYEAKGDLQNARQYYSRTMASNVHNLQSAIARPHARMKLAGASQ